MNTNPLRSKAHCADRTPVFLLVAGVTGSLLAFYHELDVILNPSLYHIASDPSAEPMDVFSMRQIVDEQVPGMTFNSIALSTPPDESVVFYGTPESEGESAVEMDSQYFIDSRTGRILGSRSWGDIRQGTKNLMPFIYRLHYQLALGEVGSLLFGIAALLWTFDCFVGAYLTFPPRGKRNLAQAGASKRRNRLVRWLPAWLIHTGSLFKLTFTWHRASGLWVWVPLLIFAWSAVGLNLPQVYSSVMKATIGMNDWGYRSLPIVDDPQPRAETDWRTAYGIGNRLFRQESEKRGIEMERPERLMWLPSYGLFRLQWQTSRDVGDSGRTTLYFHADTQQVAYFGAPTGERLGNTVTVWLYQLHFAAVGGLPYKIFVSVLGLLIGLLSVSGIYIWWAKRKSRLKQEAITRPRQRDRNSTQSVLEGNDSVPEQSRQTSLRESVS